MTSKKIWRATLLAASLSLGALPAAQAELTVGVVLSLTGPASGLGIPVNTGFALWPETVGGEKVKFITLDDGSDPAKAQKNVQRLISEDKVDVMVGSTITPNSLAMVDVAAETGTPVVSMAASAVIVEPQDVKKRWAFKTPQNDAEMAKAIVEHMQGQKIKSVAFIGFADAYGEGWYQEFSKAAQAAGIKVLTNERYNRTDTSVTGQVLKMIAAKPDAVLIAGAGTPAALPQKTLKERGYRGTYYQTHGVANNDFLRVGGKDIEGTFLPAGPVLVSAQLPADNPVKASATEYVQKYEATYGKGSVSTFGAHAWDAGKLIEAAVPVALKKAQPGTPEFRAALRDALENVKNVAGAHGVFNMSPTDHVGLDNRSRVMVVIENGGWKLIK